MGAIVFQDSDFKKLEEYTALCPVEIACMGYATLEGGDVMVKDVFLVPQTVSLSSVEFLEEGLPYAVQKALEEDRVEELKFCWHSHATHDAFFSAIDEDMVEKVRKSGPIDWFASSVLNKRGKTYAQLDFFRPGMDSPVSDFLERVTVELSTHVEGRIDQAQLRMAEIEMFAKKKEYTKPTTTTTATGGDKPVLEPPHGEQPGGKASGRDWRLHNEARQKGWDCYVDDDQNLAYYWNSETGEYEGSAVIPLDEKGDWKIDINVTVFSSDDGNASEGETTEMVPLTDAEEEMLNSAIEKRQV